MAAHRGIGTRLLDGRQIKIMALLEQGRHQEAAAVIDASVPAEPWETAVTAILRGYCQQQATPATPAEPSDAIEKAIELLGQGEPTTAAFRSRAGLTALDLAADQPEASTAQLHDAIAQLAATDAYAARNALGHPIMRARMTCHREQQLARVIKAAGFGAGHLTPGHMDAVTTAVGQAEEHLRVLLRRQASRKGLNVSSSGGRPTHEMSQERPGRLRTRHEARAAQWPGQCSFPILHPAR
jgi:hypothetical protein